VKTTGDWWRDRCTARQLTLVMLILSTAGLRAQAPPAAGPESGQAGPALVARAAEVASVWRPDQRLYVKGNLGVGASPLAEFEQWLDTHAAHWVVVLVEQADDERYTDAEGRSYQGVEAVSQALGKGLMNQTAFGQQSHPRTGERDAAFFVLHLKERRLSYYGSEAQDRRGLGEEQWIGNLDGPAIAAMRSGGRVLDAARDTITHISRQLGARYQDLAQRPSATAARSSLESASASLQSARASHRRADSGYAAQLIAATRALDTVEASLAAAARAAQTRRTLAGVGGLAGLLSLLAVGLVLNRRRLPLKTAAEALCATWQRGLDEKKDALTQLLDRRATVIGLSRDEAAQRFSGETLRLGEQIIQDVDQLFNRSPRCSGRVWLRSESESASCNSGSGENPESPVQKVKLIPPVRKTDSPRSTVADLAPARCE